MISIKKILLLLCAIVLAQGFKGGLHASEHFVGLHDVVPSEKVIKAPLRSFDPPMRLRRRAEAPPMQRLALDKEDLKSVKVHEPMSIVANQQGVSLVEPERRMHDVPESDITTTAGSTNHFPMVLHHVDRSLVSVAAPSASMTLDDASLSPVKFDKAKQLLEDPVKEDEVSAQLSARDKKAKKKMRLARKRVLDKVHQLSTYQIAFTREVAAMDWLPKKLKQPLVEQSHQLQKLIDLAKELASARGNDIAQAQQRVEEQLEVVEQHFVPAERALSKYKDFTSLQKLATRHGLDVSDDDSVTLGEYPEGQRPLEVVAKKSDDVANAESKTRVSTPVGQEVNDLPKTASVTRVSTPIKDPVASNNPYDTDSIGESIDVSKEQHTYGPPTEELKEEGASFVDGDTKDLKKGVGVQEQSEVRATTSWVRTLKWAVTGLTAVVAAYHVAKVVTAKPADLAATASTVTDTVATNASQQDSKGWSFYPRY